MSKQKPIDIKILTEKLTNIKNTMCKLKSIGILLMLITHPIGERFWLYILTSSPVAISPDGGVNVEIRVHTILSIFEIFLTGLSLLILGIVLDYKKK